MAIWPSTLPQVAFQSMGYREMAPDIALRTQMDAGPAKVRRRFTAGVRNIDFTIPCSAAEIATLDTFYVTTLQGGVLPFDWTHPRTGAAASFRFRGRPEYTDLGAVFSARLELEILP